MTDHTYLKHYGDNGELAPLVVDRDDGAHFLADDPEVIAWLGAGHTLGEPDRAQTTPNLVLAPREFIALFTDEEREKFSVARQTNWQIDWFIQSAMAGNVDLTNVQVAASLGECVQAGLLTADRVKTILSGTAPQ